jgi:hypothetical protein
MKTADKIRFAAINMRVTTIKLPGFLLKMIRNGNTKSEAKEIIERGRWM